jgi:hypothetical protein
MPGAGMFEGTPQQKRLVGEGGLATQSADCHARVRAQLLTITRECVHQFYQTRYSSCMKSERSSRKTGSSGSPC